MITITVQCPHCGSDTLVHNGPAPNGKQKYLCRACQRQSREHPRPHAYAQERKEEILRAAAMLLFTGAKKPRATRKTYFFLVTLVCIVLAGGWFIGVLI